MKLSANQEKALQMLDTKSYKGCQSGLIKLGTAKLGKGTFKSLVKRGLAEDILSNNLYNITGAGKKIVINTLHNVAKTEMENEFQLRNMRIEQSNGIARVAEFIRTNYGLEDTNDFRISADHRLRDRKLVFSIELCQQVPEYDRFWKSYVRIVSTRGEDYMVATSSSHWDLPTAKRYAELMTIAVQICESGILES